MISVTVDTVVAANTPGDVYFLLVERKNEPFKGQWALPGGFLNEGEDPKTGALRELAEETGLILPNDDSIIQIGAFGNPTRDPRGHTVSIAYFAKVFSRLEVRGSDDAALAAWFSLDEVGAMQLAFDHQAILNKVIKYAIR